MSIVSEWKKVKYCQRQKRYLPISEPGCSVEKSATRCHFWYFRRGSQTAMTRTLYYYHSHSILSFHKVRELFPPNKVPWSSLNRSLFDVIVRSLWSTLPGAYHTVLYIVPLVRKVIDFTGKCNCYTGCLQIQPNKFPGDFQEISRTHLTNFQ